jgi:hypothetical protein
MLISLIYKASRGPTPFRSMQHSFYHAAAWASLRRESNREDCGAA